MNVIEKNNITIFGNGTQPLLLAHGLGCDQHMWRFITPAFKEDYKIILFDHIGFGKADNTGYSREKYNSLQAYANDILDICEELSLQEVNFVGHSVSSIIGMLAAIKAPILFKRMVFISPSPCYINDTDYNGGLTRNDVEGMLQVMDTNYLKWSTNMAPVVMGNSAHPELSTELQQSFCRSNHQIAKDFARLTFLSDNRSDLKELQTETLILQCSEDLIAPIEVGNYVHQQIQNSELIVLSATGHCPHLSAPFETIAAMKTFL